MKLYEYPKREEWPALLQRPAIDTATLESSVGKILADVKQEGDAAVRRYAAQFDKVQLRELRVSPAEFAAAAAALDEPLKKAILQAKQNIETFHRAQQEAVKIIETMPGVQCWRKAVAIEKVGLYIPGGSAPLFSTILMLGIPAMIAGCRQIVLCTPSDAKGQVHPAVLFAAQQTGLDQVYKIGGVQAIAAMAYGTETVPRVHKIFGPGNQYVTCAKQLVNRQGLAIDMPAGPSEVAVLADESCVPAFVAADLLSQAEHGPDSQVLLVTTTSAIVPAIQQEVAAQLAQLPRRDIAARALENSRIVVLRTMEEAMELLNAYAPEHLIIACRDDMRIADGVINAGSVFLGNYSPESAGDYASGTNHTLPTNGYATAYSGVSLDSFVKKITFQRLSASGLQALGPAIEAMAAAEGLDAHRRAVSLRLAPQAEGIN